MRIRHFSWLAVAIAFAALFFVRLAVPAAEPSSPVVNQATATPPLKVDFNHGVVPILAENCFKCHGPDAGQRKSGLRLDRREQALKPAESGKVAIVPGKPDDSELVRRIFSSDPDERMPPPDSNKHLSDAQKQTLRNWIAAGAKYELHWSFVAPVRPALARVKQADWVRNPIDNFILAKLEAEGLKPSPEADRVTLIRRLTLDLIGLPPKPGGCRCLRGRQVAGCL